MTDLTPEKVEAAFRPPRSQWWDVWDQFKTHKGALVGLAVFVLILIAVIFGPYIWRLDPGFVDPNPVNMLKLRNKGPSLEHPFGTDQLGRDMLARMMAGGKVSIAVGMTAMFLSLFLGTLIGVLAGYFKKHLGPADKEELLGTIEDYHRGLVPLIVPIVLLQHYVRTYDEPYLKRQVYLHPHPLELMLRNHV